METAYERGQMLDLADKDFKTALKRSKELKEITLKEEMGGLMSMSYFFKRECQ